MTTQTLIILLEKHFSTLIEALCVFEEELAKWIAREQEDNDHELLAKFFESLSNIHALRADLPEIQRLIFSRALEGK